VGWAKIAGKRLRGGEEHDKKKRISLGKIFFVNTGLMKLAVGGRDQLIRLRGKGYV